MAKIRARNGQYEVCEALPDGRWSIYALPSLDDAMRVAGMEPALETGTPMAECDEDEDFSGLTELLWGDA